MPRTGEDEEREGRRRGPGHTRSEGRGAGEERGAESDGQAVEDVTGRSGACSRSRVRRRGQPSLRRRIKKMSMGSMPSPPRVSASARRSRRRGEARRGGGAWAGAGPARPGLSVSRSGSAEWRRRGPGATTTTVPSRRCRGY
ncbi:hypothetical protein Mp_1g13270 [Marchantia polymorpha subsp. ruderalis]|uniref:Uncharacterized protein n=2 Tax=Marchantia polymorpha TaxID=3197 RepID=A0AAF6APN9_MARPO|nr:hypothetical protein MARPO_0019s0097 [Marchantia polymorpha]BBM98409.1 hypothetical protein Mp_1g13270 [Marchantia polymorpha subsp. ruderalis]|eukprot:PTQ44679.1 hypothetical protein MARPO_0019s0097 [Marchantia polymorpha]